MHEIKIGPKTWTFKSSFNDFNLSNIIPYMSIHADMDSLHEKYVATYNSIEPLEAQLSFIDKYSIQEFSNVKKIEKLLFNARQECSDLQMKIHLIRVDFLSFLCTKTNQFRKWAMNTNGVDKDIIDTCLKVLFDQLGSFTDYWDSVPIINKFTYKTGRFLGEEYKVHDMDKTTLYRETLSHNIANKAMSHRGKLDAGIFDDICEFVATLVRPTRELEEISFNSKAFIAGKKVKGLSNLEKLDYYIERLDKVIAKRKKQFESLPLKVGIGVIICYYQKKKLLETNTTKSTKDQHPV